MVLNSLLYSRRADFLDKRARQVPLAIRNVASSPVCQPLFLPEAHLAGIHESLLSDLTLDGVDWLFVLF